MRTSQRAAQLGLGQSFQRPRANPVDEVRQSVEQSLPAAPVALSKVLDLCGRAGFEVPLNPPSGPRSLENEVFEGIELTAKYDGYLRQQARVAERMKQLEEMRIPRDLDFAGMKGLSYETVEKLSRVRPATVGQASRVPGVRPADIALLIGNLRAGKVPLRDSSASGVSGD